MGVLEQVLAAVDNAKRVAGRNMSDLVSSPAAYAERMTDALRNSNRNVVPTAAQGELTSRPMTRDEINQKFIDASADTLSGGLGVIKPKGGNWLSGKYGPEAQLKSLKTAQPDAMSIWQQRLDNPNTSPEARAIAEQQIARMTDPKEAAVNQFVDRQLTKYVKNDMASPNDPIRLMADKFPAEKAQKLAEAEARVQALRQKQTAQAATRGVPEEMLTRTRQDVLRAEEARDVIAENQGLHINVEGELNNGIGNELIMGTREDLGFPAEGMGQSPLAKAWEYRADDDFNAGRAKDFQLPGDLKQDPWLAKVDPNTPVYSTAYDAGGFSHVVDELRNSVREGRLTPEQLQKMPIDQAVKHVAEVNALRAVEANKARAMDMADMPIHKEYPDTGMSWRQLKQLEGPEGYSKLEKWLKDEGDAMGHCVGGYCDDVASGQSNIYSLRDAKGKPSVTIETTGPFDTQGYDVDELPGILQIKGKNNAAPPPEALPYIQDFIKSGKWSEIQDLQNAGMYKVGNQHMTKNEMQSVLDRRLPDGRPVVDQLGEDVMRAWQRDVIDYGEDRI